MNTKYIEKAETLRSKGFFKEAFKIWQKIYKNSLKKKNPSLAVESLIVLADLNRIMGRFDKAIEQYNESIELSEVLDKHLSLADSLSGLSLCLKAKGNWRDGLKYIRGARKIYEKNNDKRGIAFTFWAEGAIWRFGGRIKKSLENFKRALQQFKRLKDSVGLGYTYCGLGGSSRVAGDFYNSLKFYKKANKIFQRIEDKFGIAYSYCGIGNAFRMKADLNNAKKNFKKALSLYKEIGDIVSSSYTLWSLAMNSILEEYENKKNGKKTFKEALDYIISAEKNFKKCYDPRGLIYCKIAKAMIYFLTGKEKRGKSLLLEAIESAKKYDFILEKKYANLLLNGKYQVPFNIP